MVKYNFINFYLKLMTTYKFLILFENVNDTNKTTITRQIGILSNKYKQQKIRIEKFADNSYIVIFQFEKITQTIKTQITRMLNDDFTKLHSRNVLICEMGLFSLKKPLF